MLRRSTTFHLVESWNLHYNQIFVIILSDYYVSKSTFSITYSPGSNKSGFNIPLCFFSVLGSRLELSHNTFGIDNVNDFSRFSLGVEIDEEKQGRTSEWGLERGREERRGWKKRVKSPEAPYQLIEHIILFFLKIIFINGLLVPPPQFFHPSDQSK